MAATISQQPTNWGEAEDEDYLPPSEIHGPDAKGIKTVIEYVFDDNHERQKITRRFRVSKQIKKVPKAAISRQIMRNNKFGQSYGDPLGPTFATTSISIEDVMIDDPRDELKKAKQEDEQLLRQLKAGFIGGLRTGLVDQPPSGLKRPMATGNEESADAAGTGGKYVPPNMRGEGTKRSDEFESEEDVKTLRITNFTVDTNEDEIRALCSQYGSVARVFLAKDRETGESKGFAYVSFHLKEDAARALENLDRAGIHHVILHVEWARPSRKDAGNENILSKGFTSGYGKALPQNVNPMKGPSAKRY